MHHRTRTLVIGLVLLATFLCRPVSLSAQDIFSDWSRLNSVPAQSKLLVELKNGKTVKGKLSKVSEAFLTLVVKGSAMELKREDILRVHQTSKVSVAKSTLIGLGLGAGAGAAIGAVGDASSDAGGFEKIDNVAAAGFTVIGAGVGALTGFLLGKNKSKQVLVYQSN